jgi:hypothetical protein
MKKRNGPKPTAEVAGLHGCRRCGTYGKLEVGDSLGCPNCGRVNSMTPVQDASEDFRRCVGVAKAACQATSQRDSVEGMPLFPQGVAVE